MADPQVGELLPLETDPGHTQPGGVGTVVIPGQTVGARNGWFFPGCGHSIRSWDVRQQTIVGVAKKLITCPQCGYLVRIMTLAEYEQQLQDGGIILG